MRHSFACALRWSDMDAFGHVNNVVLLRYLEEARIDLLFRLARESGQPAGGPGDEPAPFEGGSVVARHEIDYLRPLVFRHAPVTVETWVEKVGNASATVAYEVRDETVVYARAATVVVPFDLSTQRPRRLTATERAFLERYSDDAAAGSGGAGSATGPDAAA